MRLGFANVTLLLLAGTVIAADPPAYVDPELTAERSRALGVPQAGPTGRSGWGSESDRCLHSGRVDREETDPFAGSRPPDAHSPRDVRPDRLAADAGGSRCLPRGQIANAYEKVVDRLLASPHFGERQAQHWLDLVRFAESNGYELDADRPHAWRYRDYVIKSFNADKPFDVFAKEQIAGDELAHGKPAAQVADQLIATGFHRAGPVHVVSGNLDAAVVRQEVLTEMVVGVGSAFLGLTMGCARCHDHKFDPLSQGDYYRLEAYFAGARFKDVELTSEAEQKKVVGANRRREKGNGADPQSHLRKSRLRFARN